MFVGVLGGGTKVSARRVTGLTLYLVLALVILFALMKASFLLVAFRHQLAAERLLADVTQLKPGVTTVDDLQKLVFAKYGASGPPCNADTIEERQRTITMYNSPYNWAKLPFHHLPRQVEELAGKALIPRWTILDVTLSCAGGHLSKVMVQEAQAPKVLQLPGHTALANGYSATTSIVAEFPPVDFRGQAWPVGLHYSVSVEKELAEAGVPERLVGFIVALDQHATAEQRRRALAFRLNCFTRIAECQDVNRILQPELNP